jgi:hypothetical protein
MLDIQQIVEVGLYLVYMTHADQILPIRIYIKVYATVTPTT